MLPHQQRVVDEKAELETKLVALSRFISIGGVFETLDPAEKVRLRAQRNAMNEYHDILAERIAAFK